MREIVLAIVLSVSYGMFAQKSNPPKLIVGIVIDQMCYEYLYRYYDKFSTGGFRKLMEQGTNCRNTLYNYVPTFTGPGHASIYTGATPSDHGIVANEWFERESGKVVNCVDDMEVKPVGTTSTDGLCSPHYLKTYTVTDQLKMTYPEAKVISMSIKDRGAILPGGHKSDGSYWYDYTTGKFVTSSYFEATLPEWVVEFNSEEQVNKYLDQTWSTLLNIGAYTESGPDNSPYEQLLPGKTSPTFPYDLKAMCNGIPNYSLFTVTPFANSVLTELAIRSMDGEKLAQDGQTDILCISYSTPDIAGHSFGPYSIELEDIYLRLDLELAKLIKALEEHAGKDGFILFLTADHAVVPVPQYLTDNGLPGGYLFLNEKMADLEASVVKRFRSDLILDQENLNIYLDHSRMDSLGIERREVMEFVASEVREWIGVKAVYTIEDLMRNGGDDLWRDMVRRGFHPAESGDVLFILEPGYLPKSADTPTAHKGTSHGSAFNYDTHVPLLWYGKGIPRQEVFRTISITDIAATLTHLLYLQRSGAMTGSPILELFNNR